MWNGKKFASSGSYHKKYKVKAYHEDASSNWIYIEFNPNLSQTSDQPKFYGMWLVFFLVNLAPHHLQCFAL